MVVVVIVAVVDGLDHCVARRPSASSGVPMYMQSVGIGKETMPLAGTARAMRAPSGATKGAGEG